MQHCDLLIWSRRISAHSTAIRECSSEHHGSLTELSLHRCFPIVPKIAAHHLRLPIANALKPITLLGGLTSFGGAGNNYSLHVCSNIIAEHWLKETTNAHIKAIMEMTRELRQGHRRNGLILANGGVMTHQHAVILSRSSRSDHSPYPDHDILPEHLSSEAPPFAEHPEGEAVIEVPQ